MWTNLLQRSLKACICVNKYQIPNTKYTCDTGQTRNKLLQLRNASSALLCLCLVAPTVPAARCGFDQCYKYMCILEFVFAGIDLLGQAARTADLMHMRRLTPENTKYQIY